jgi:hypothetical protein
MSNTLETVWSLVFAAVTAAFTMAREGVIVALDAWPWALLFLCALGVIDLFRMRTRS